MDGKTGMDRRMGGWEEGGCGMEEGGWRREDGRMAGWEDRGLRGRGFRKRNSRVPRPGVLCV